MKVVVEISDADAKDISRVFQMASGSDANTHGPLNFESLTRMLLEDVALVNAAARIVGRGQHGTSTRFTRL